jgi:hypothetical protein
VNLVTLLLPSLISKKASRANFVKESFEMAPLVADAIFCLSLSLSLLHSARFFLLHIWLPNACTRIRIACCHSGIYDREREREKQCITKTIDRYWKPRGASNNLWWYLPISSKVSRKHGTWLSNEPLYPRTINVYAIARMSYMNPHTQYLDNLNLF